MADNNSGSKNRNVLDRKPARKKKGSAGKGKLQMKKSRKSEQKVRKTTVFHVKYGGFMVAGEGFEPPTSGL